MAFGHSSCEDLCPRRSKLSIGAGIDEGGRIGYETAGGDQIDVGVAKPPAPSLVMNEARAEGLAVSSIISSYIDGRRDHAAAHGSDISACAINVMQRTLEGFAGWLK